MSSNINISYREYLLLFNISYWVSFLDVGY